MQVLVPYDGSDPSLAALEYAVEQFADAGITALHVIDEKYIDNPYGQLLVGREELREQAMEEADGLLTEAETAAEEAEVDIDTDVVIGHPVRGILDYVDENQIDQVIMGGRGLSNVPQLLLGSVSFGVVLHADVPVTIIR
ncbi:universal stress protein [Halomicrococcus sp. NG-SE-24]|uniref:universal stress protein n=1 Tax=Halomicrococcus sp. NG-SE-24 TaxID=3436928 RepID=UPI003D9680A4